MFYERLVVCFWHLADMETVLENVWFWAQSRHWWCVLVRGDEENNRQDGL